MRLGRFTEICEDCPEENFSMFVQHRERHRTDRIDWLRAAVLGANDLTTARPVQAAFASAGTCNRLRPTGASDYAVGRFLSIIDGCGIPVGLGWN